MANSLGWKRSEWPQKRNQLLLALVLHISGWIFSAGALAFVIFLNPMANEMWPYIMWWIICLPFTLMFYVPVSGIAYNGLKNRFPKMRPLSRHVIVLVSSVILVFLIWFCILWSLFTFGQAEQRG